MATTCKLIAKTTLGSDAASVTFGSGGTIPQSFTDLLIVFSARSSRSQPEDGLGVKINSETSGYTYRVLSGNGATVSSINTAFEATWATRVVGATATSSTFGNGSVYFPNYAGSTSKSYSAESVTENNSSTAFITLSAINQSSTSAITELTLSALNGNLVSGSSFFLYGITRADDNLPGTFGIQATGGDVTISGGYKYHVFKSSDVFTVNEPGFVEALVIAGGGSGGGAGNVDNGPGGGGAGGYVYSNTLVPKGSYNVIVGAGGSPVTTGSGGGLPGVNSSFANVVAIGGGGGGGGGGNATAGGSGGGSAGGNPGFDTGDNSVTGQGFRGGYKSTPNQTGSGGGGGGGASAVGANGVTRTGGAGGAGLSTFSAWAQATGTGSSNAYAGGGGGAGGDGTGGGGTGGGGAGQRSNSPSGNPGTMNTGSGGGGSFNSGSNTKGPAGSGGSGIVIIRYPVS